MTFHFLPRRWIDHAPRGHGNRAARRAFRNAALSSPCLLDQMEQGTVFVPQPVAAGALLFAEQVCRSNDRAAVRLIGGGW